MSPLLDADYYHAKLKPILAEWVFLWLTAQHVHGIDAGDAIEYLLDLEVEYMIGDHSSILVGGNNVLDNNGQKATDVNNLGFNSATILGNTYSQYSPFGISGAFWYARYRYNF